MASFLSACKKADIWMPYSVPTEVKNNNSIISENPLENLMPGFSKDLAVSDKEDFSKNNFSINNSEAGLLVDLNKKDILYSKNCFKKMYPASITKIMTALVAVENCNTDDLIVCTDSVEKIDVDGAVLLGLKKGDSLTLDQALRLSLLSSYNDVAVAIAVHVGGDLDNFARMMNEKAKSLGATKTNFVNPSGLPDDNHYTTVYDLYLIFNDAIKNPTILEIIQSKDYSTTYHNANNVEINASALNTNRYFQGYFTAPENVTIVGGKTGTTTEAGYCLMLLTRDKFSNPYISVILKSDSSENLYYDMSELLKNNL